MIREYSRHLKNSGLIIGTFYIIVFLIMAGCTKFQDGSSIRAWDPTTSVISQFLKAAVTGDTSKIKVSKKDETEWEKEWDEIDE